MPPPYSHADTSGNTASLWAAGLKGLTDVLTAREVARLDAADRAALEADRAERRADNRRATDLQEKQINAQIEDRKARTEADVASKAEAAQIKQRMAEMQQQYALTPNPLLAAQIKDLGGNVPEPKVAPKRDIRTDAAGNYIDFTDPDHPKVLYRGEAKPTTPKEPKPTDDPKLPNGVKEWLATKPAGTGITAAEWAQQKRVHPNADIGAAATFLKNLREGLFIPMEPGGAGPAPVAAAAPTDVSAPPPFVGGQAIDPQTLAVLPREAQANAGRAAVAQARATGFQGADESVAPIAFTEAPPQMPALRPNLAPGQVALPPATRAPIPSRGAGPSGPAIGETRTINGIPAVWDGHGWLPVRGE